MQAQEWELLPFLKGGMVVMSSAMVGKSKATASYPRIHDRHTGYSIDVR
jgi:hypothetical protein